MTDATHDPARRSWVESAEGSDFPIQNLPYGRFRRDESDAPRLGVAIGDQILDLRLAAEAGLVDPIAGGGMLNPIMAIGADGWRALRESIGLVLDAKSTKLPELLVPQSDAEMLVPAWIGDYTDFYCSIHHATNVGAMFRPDNPLLPNYKHLPIGYHGRASSIVVSGTEVRRPHGQTVGADGPPPNFGPIRLLDYEMEMGFFVGAGNALGHPIGMNSVRDQLFGMCIVNDWSARDVQKWEYQPLGPFNAKNFCTSVSPWVVTLDALAPYREPGEARGADDPALLPYLERTDDYGVNITLEVSIASADMRAKGMAPTLISRGNFRDMYWTIAQMLVHHTSTGCNLQPGDLIASGTVSGTAEDSRGCLLERTWRGENPVTLGDGTERKFLADGDEVTMRAFCETDGAVRIGFGECRGVVTPAL